MVGHVAFEIWPKPFLWNSVLSDFAFQDGQNKEENHCDEARLAETGILFSEMLYIPTAQFQDLVLHLSLFAANTLWTSSLFSWRLRRQEVFSFL